jgi:hypothetical protein
VEGYLPVYSSASLHFGKGQRSPGRSYLADLLFWSGVRQCSGRNRGEFCDRAWSGALGKVELIGEDLNLRVANQLIAITRSAQSIAPTTTLM